MEYWYNKYYKCLKNNSIQYKDYLLIPIRYEDRLMIMKWRNEQIHHLRQENPLTVDDQENYFRNVILKSFDKDCPQQILFSLLKQNTCIGYGGLVHINWEEKTAEISFIMATELEDLYFKDIWGYYLALIEIVAFQDLNFNKIYTYAFDFRTKLFDVLESLGYTLEKVLKAQNPARTNVLIHSKLIPTQNIQF